MISKRVGTLMPGDEVVTKFEVYDGSDFIETKQVKTRKTLPDGTCVVEYDNADPDTFKTIEEVVVVYNA